MSDQAYCLLLADLSRASKEQNIDAVVRKAVNEATRAIVTTERAPSSRRQRGNLHGTGIRPGLTYGGVYPQCLNAADTRRVPTAALLETFPLFVVRP